MKMALVTESFFPTIDGVTTTVKAIADRMIESGHEVRGWLSPWISESRVTPDLLAEAGLRYTLNWCHDDQPVAMRTRSGATLWSVPYPQELNDIPMVIARQMDARDFCDMVIDNLDEMMRQSRAQPLVMMIAGVNGAGKTTSIGKLAKHLQSFDQSVLLAAGDTFRAAAREQLAVWGERNNVTVVQQESGDPAAVIFDAVSAARARKIDVMMADTAGRLPTQLHLMEELKKVKRVISKAHDGAPHEVLLVIDANTGQNALTQVKAFDDALSLTGLIVTKLDGTAKGGILAAIARQRPVPVYFIGVGEKVEDLQPFSAVEFADALLG